ncbi:hypothetical protein ABC304_17940 [Microbacterium sp. 1P10UB]|uniref:hypothetical protein n=1 Tax=unclassified Microbacterium TaxID=2609290 RepID=UPI0039A07BAA
MSDPTTPADLTGTADERRQQLAQRQAEGPLPADWVTRQLVAALEAWAADETVLDIDQESRTDF